MDSKNSELSLTKKKLITEKKYHLNKVENLVEEICQNEKKEYEKS